MNLSAGYGILVQIGIGFIVSLIFGFALLKIYDGIQKALHEKNRLKLWWNFSSAIFLFVMIVFLFGRVK